MIDLHTHTIFSDGELIPFELVRRAEVIGYRVIALTDHLDFSNMELVIPRIAAAAAKLNGAGRIVVITGCELTHIPPDLFGEAVAAARALGARIVVGHGESPVEPVAAGTNRAAIEAGVDILAHPGLITPDDARRAAEKNVCLELTARGGHNTTNGHVAQTARAAGAQLVVNTDAHSPRDLITAAFARLVARGAGLSDTEFDSLVARTESWLRSRV